MTPDRGFGDGAPVHPDGSMSPQGSELRRRAFRRTKRLSVTEVVRVHQSLCRDNHPARDHQRLSVDDASTTRAPQPANLAQRVFEPRPPCAPPIMVSRPVGAECGARKHASAPDRVDDGPAGVAAGDPTRVEPPQPPTPATTTATTAQPTLRRMVEPSYGGAGSFAPSRPDSRDRYAPECPRASSANSGPLAGACPTVARVRLANLNRDGSLRVDEIFASGHSARVGTVTKRNGSARRSSGSRLRSKRRRGSRNAGRRQLGEEAERTEVQRLADEGWVEWGGELIWAVGFTFGRSALRTTGL